MTRAGLVLSLLVGLSSSAFADVFETIDYPGAVSTIAAGINNKGQIVGQYFNGTDYFPFLYSGGVFSTINDPGLTSPYTNAALGINDAGQITITSEAGSGFPTGALDNGGSISGFRYPGSSYTGAIGINNSGEISGYFSNTSNFFGQGFTYSGGVFSVFDVPFPGAMQTFAYGLNNSGQIVGDYYDASGYHGFLDSGGLFSPISVPGAPNATSASGINDSGQIVGYYHLPSGYNGFLDNGGVPSTFDVPGASQTLAEGINNNGQIVGYYYDGSGGIHGFEASPNVAPEPSFLVPLILALGGLIVAKRCCRRKTSSVGEAGER